ncbi:hypothetical protein QFC22_001272 [Naganishia vaughanmartiniae]|uniref:Uncharacterized protein n=1 Tax=Naganishia vaughanmartiniae TaxID=1424756 RepID=A0ACC2XGP0_9TREE|nr:hypothetical protein QFC22_001272 [Naganishia vaughanmartiniae]
MGTDPSKLESGQEVTSVVTDDGPLRAPAHTLSSAEIVSAFHTDIDNGLTESQVQRNATQYGPNKLKEIPPPSFLSILMRNTLNAMTLVLIAAMAVSFGTQDFISGGVIAALIVINVGVGTINEYNAEKTVAALEAIGAPTAVVIRKENEGAAGNIQTIKTDLVVPGDILLIKIGDIVPADCRILEGQLAGLECDEALLTGESLPSVKTEDSISDPVCPVGDRTCMIYSGSQAAKGRAKVVCIATGMNTELGKISAALSRKEKNNKTGFAATWHKCKVFLGLAETTPLQIKLNKLAYVILFFACIVAVVVVASTGFKNVPLSIATYAVAAAVSLLPASLPAVIALSLSTASKELAQNNALVRRMDAIETLSAVTDVCSDKTGTITLGKMVTRRVWVPASIARGIGKVGADAEFEADLQQGQYFTIDTASDPFLPKGNVRPDRDTSSVADDKAIAQHATQDTTAADDERTLGDSTGIALNPHNVVNPLHELTLCAALCSSATIQRIRSDSDSNSESSVDEKEEASTAWEGHGDATEVALQVFAHKLGYGKPHLTSTSDASDAVANTTEDDDDLVFSTQPGKYELLVEHAFDSSIKRMSMAYICTPPTSSGEQPYVLVLMKGAFERVFDQCTTLLAEGGRALEKADADQIQCHYDRLASDGLRVLTMCSKRLPADQADAVKAMTRDDLETSMSFLGLAGIYDPPRVESALAVQDCHKAAIIPRMLTGDHVGTAIAIAQQVGILRKDYPKSAVMTGPEFDALSEDEIDKLDPLPSVVARCAPETKVRMVEALHRRNRLCVMTGDGVNDAPSLKRADVGVAMGKNGSDVAKQSAEIVLSDDNFATIIVAIRKGRGIFFNLSKFMLYLMSGNIAQIVLMLIGLAFIDDQGISTFPISPVAILWINTLCAGPPALALGLEPTPSDAMDRKPKEYKTMFTLVWWIDLFVYGFLLGAFAIANFAIVMWGYFDGYLGVECNENLREDVCNHTGRARGSVFASFLIVLMVHAFVCKHPTRSILQMNLLENRVLLWSVIILGISVFPVVYIPVINDKVFLLFPIKWEWGLVFASALAFLVITEVYKVGRRAMDRRTQSRAVVEDVMLGEDGQAEGKRIAANEKTFNQSV